MRELRVGDRIKDNDPREGHRVLSIVALEGDKVVAQTKLLKCTRIAKSRIYTDGKPRKSGFSLLTEA